jgi:hypothetical protein
MHFPLRADGLTLKTIASRTATAAIVGGTATAIIGGDFANGAKTAAYAQLYNDSKGFLSDKINGRVKYIKEHDWNHTGNANSPEMLALSENAQTLGEAVALVLAEPESFCFAKRSSLIGDIGNYLGQDVRVITNDAGDKIFVNAENTRKIRFDYHDTYPHQNPHLHVEEYFNGRWNSARVYPKDVESW